MNFRYARYGNVLRPVIPIKVKHGTASVLYQVLVDSGADLCIFDAEVGEAIGVEVSKGEPKEVFGVGGKASIYYLHEIVIEVGGWPFKIKAGFMPDVSGRRMQYGLVGQNGFFEFFRVTFDLTKEEVEIKKKS